MHSKTRQTQAKPLLAFDCTQQSRVATIEIIEKFEPLVLGIPPMAHQDCTVRVCCYLMAFRDCILKPLNFGFFLVVSEKVSQPYHVEGLEVMALDAMIDEV
ncbi:hypothetical protein ACFX1R_042359 [Malus domestica]